MPRSDVKLVIRSFHSVDFNFGIVGADMRLNGPSLSSRCGSIPSTISNNHADFAEGHISLYNIGTSISDSRGCLAYRIVE